MSKTDTYATKDMKGKIDRTSPKADNGKKTTVSYARRTMLECTGEA